VFRRITRSLTTALASLIVATAVLPVAPPPVAARDGATMVEIANRYRANAGVLPVKLQAGVDEIAIERGRQLAAARTLGHDFDYIIRRLAEKGICWSALGEIVAWNTASESERLERFATQWYNSDPHREIMLGSGYTHVGGSWKTGTDGRHYAVMVFVKICGATPQPVSYGGFTDIAGSKYRDAITWVADRGMLIGCGGGRFCPDGNLTRGQLARALARGLNLPATANDYFSDDDGHRYEANINRLRAGGLTTGCGGGQYCPDTGVRRGVLAGALARALRLPAASRDYFRDDDGTAHEDGINRVMAAGIMSGCGGGNFCPGYRVKRGQAAAFLRNAFD
jgi:uncharacterized protein YkwD